MSDENEKTPLEETFDLPSMKDVTEHFKNVQDDNDDDYLNDIDNEDDEDDEEDNEDEKEEKELSAKDLLLKIDNLSRKLNESSIDEETFKKRFENDMNDVYKEAMDSFRTIINASLSMEATAGAKFLTGAAKILEIASTSKNSIMNQMIELEKLNIKRNELESKKYPTSNQTKDIPNDIEGKGEGESENTVGSFSRNDLVKQYRNIEDDLGEDDNV